MTITKSGELASFYTVNKAPIKHLRVYFSPKQAGSGDPSPENVREIEGWKKILCNINSYNLLTYWKNGYYDRSRGWVYSNNNAAFYPIKVKQGDTVKFTCSHKFYSAAMYLCKFRTDYTIDSSTYITNYNLSNILNRTINIPEDCYIIIQLDYQSPRNKMNAFEWEPQITINNDINIYNNIQGNCNNFDWSSSLGTIYGGYADLISGLLTVTHQSKTFNGNESENWNIENWNNVKNFYILVPDAKIIQYTSLYCNRISPSSQQHLQTGTCGISSTRNLNLAVGTLLNISTVEELRAWLLQNNTQIVYSLETPITHQLTPQQLETFLGRNNIWSNADRVEIEYDLAESNDILYRRRNVLEKGYPHIVTPEANPILTFNTDMIASLKECKIYFSPVQAGSGDPSPDNIRSISGWTNIDITRSGKNMLDASIFANPTYSVTYSDGILTGTADNLYQASLGHGALINNFNGRLHSTFSLSAYTDGNQSTSGLGLQPYFRYNNPSANKVLYTYSNSTNNYIRKSLSLYNYNNTQVPAFFGFSYYSAVNNVWHIKELQWEMGDSLTDYEPYNGLTTPIIFPNELGTVYGGYVDLITGELVITHRKITMDGRTGGDQGKWFVWSNEFASKSYTLTLSNAAVMRVNADVQQYGVVCNMASAYGLWSTSDGKVINDMITFFCYTDGDNTIAYPKIAFPDSYNMDTMEKANNWLKELYDNGTPFEYVYPYNTPLRYQINPISLKTLRGINNIWSTANGNIELKYYTH